MIRKTTWIVLGIFIVLLAAALYMNRAGISLSSQTTPTPTGAPALFSEIDFDQLTRIEFNRSANAPVLENSAAEGGFAQPSGPINLQKGQDNLWQLATIDGTELDQGKVTQVISSLESIQPLAELDLNTPIDATGLDAPNYTFTLIAADGSRQTVKIGNQTSTQSGYYAQLEGSSKIFVITRFTVEDLVNLMNVDNLAAQESTLITE